MGHCLECSAELMLMILLKFWLATILREKPIADFPNSLSYCKEFRGSSFMNSSRIGGVKRKIFGGSNLTEHDYWLHFMALQLLKHDWPTDDVRLQLQGRSLPEWPMDRVRVLNPTSPDGHKCSAKELEQNVHVEILAVLFFSPEVTEME